MAGQLIIKPRARLWMKILGVSVLIVILINIVIVLFYSDQGWTGAGRGPRKGDGVSGTRDLVISGGQDTHGGVSGNHRITVNLSGGQDTHGGVSGSNRVSEDIFGDDGTNLNISGHHQTKNAENEGSSSNPGTKTENVPLILWWDPVSGMRGEIIHCGHHTCDVTVDRNRWREQEVMVMSFYGTDLSMHDLPVPRGANDLWALFHDESPKNLDFLFSHQAVMELFNYTATFRSHAHLPVPTQWLEDAKELTSVQYTVPVSVKSRLRGTQGLAPVVYVQSDCSVPSDRDHFVQLLQRHVPVDCYGSCLHNRRFPNGSSLSFEDGMAAMTADSFYRFLAGYKFAIAIENAVCPGYITEKFWRPLHLGVVPIVFGASNIKEFLPAEHSALVVTDYDSVEDLARAIQFYDSHDSQYSGLLQHKTSGVTNPALLKHLQPRPPTSHYRVSMLQDYQCLLCEKLHQARAARWSGQPLPRSVASADHFGCPKPGKFNERGQYVETEGGHWDVPWRYGQAMVCVMKNMIHSGTHTSQPAFDALVDQTVKTWDHSHCQHYFH